MNPPPKKIGPNPITYGDDPRALKHILAIALPLLDGAIDRINELETKYENHYHEYQNYEEKDATSEPMQFASEEPNHE